MLPRVPARVEWVQYIQYLPTLPSLYQAGTHDGTRVLALRSGGGWHRTDRDIGDAPTRQTNQLQGGGGVPKWYILAGPVCRYLQYLHLQSISSPMAWVLTTLLLFLHLSSGWSVSIYTTLLSEHTLERRLDAGAIRKRVSYIPILLYPYTSIHVEYV